MNNQNEPLFKPDGKNAIHDGIEHGSGGGKALIDPTDTVLLLLDHQSGLFQNLKDISVAELRREKSAGDIHLSLPVHRANHPRRNGRAAFATRAVGEQRVQLIALAVVPIPNPIQPSFAFGDAAVSSWNRVAENVAARHVIERELVEKEFAQRRG